LPSLDAGRAAYDNYISNGIMKQLRRLDPGKNIEEAHMRNRQLIAAYAFEKGQKENVISKFTQDGKTFFKINNYDKLRAIFGELLKELQRIKSQGDYNAGRNLVEKYGVIADQKMLAEVKSRSEKLNIPPYSGFIQPEFNLIKDAKGTIIDIKIFYPMDFMDQMLKFSTNYSFLPDMN
jgi:dipeptidyl-peptidase-3